MTHPVQLGAQPRGVGVREDAALVIALGSGSRPPTA